MHVKQDRGAEKQETWVRCEHLLIGLARLHFLYHGVCSVKVLY